MRVWSVAVGTAFWPWPVVPDAPVQVPFGVQTAAITPGNPPWALVSSSAVCSWAVVEASRAFVGLGSGVAPVPGVEVGLVDPQPALTSTSTRTSTAQTEPRVYRRRNCSALP